MSRGDRKPLEVGPYPVIDAIVAQHKQQRLARLHAPGPVLARVSPGPKKAAPTARRKKRQAEKQARKRQRSR